MDSHFARLSSFLAWWGRETRDARHFCKRRVAKCETLVVLGSVESRNARRSSFLEVWTRIWLDLSFLAWWGHETGDARHFCKRRVAKCETLVVFGSVESRNARGQCESLVISGIVRSRGLLQPLRHSPPAPPPTPQPSTSPGYVFTSDRKMCSQVTELPARLRKCAARSWPESRVI